MRKVLSKKFFERGTLTVARELLGKYLVRRVNGREISAVISEVEAYDGPNDKASHASRGMTPRNKVMFGSAGVWYVYFVYGMHEMLNIVTGERGYPAAVLIRGTDKANGPGRVTKFFKIDRKLNGKSASRKTGLWIEQRSPSTSLGTIRALARIGVAYAGPVWSKKRYRFYLSK